MSRSASAIPTSTLPCVSPPLSAMRAPPDRLDAAPGVDLLHRQRQPVHDQPAVERQEARKRVDVAHLDLPTLRPEHGGESERACAERARGAEERTTGESAGLLHAALLSDRGSLVVASRRGAGSPAGLRSGNVGSHGSSMIRASTTCAPLPGSARRSPGSGRGRPGAVRGAAASAAARVTVSTRAVPVRRPAASVAAEERVERAAVADQRIGGGRRRREPASWPARRTAPSGRRPGRPARTGRAPGHARRRPAPRLPRPSAARGTPRRAAAARGRPPPARRGRRRRDARRRPPSGGAARAP